MLKGAPHQPKISMVDLNNYLPSIARETPLLHHCVHHFSLTPTFAVKELCKLTLSLRLHMQKLTDLSRLSGLFSRGYLWDNSGHSSLPLQQKMTLMSLPTICLNIKQRSTLQQQFPV